MSEDPSSFLGVRRESTYASASSFEEKLLTKVASLSPGPFFHTSKSSPLGTTANISTGSAFLLCNQSGVVTQNSLLP